MLAALTANRLLTLSNEARQVNLPHEALIQGWPALSAWIDERQAAEVKRRQLEEKAEERERLRQADGEAGCSTQWNWPKPRRGSRGRTRPNWA